MHTLSMIQGSINTQCSWIDVHTTYQWWPNAKVVNLSWHATFWRNTKATVGILDGTKLWLCSHSQNTDAQFVCFTNSIYSHLHFGSNSKICLKFQGSGTLTIFRYGPKSQAENFLQKSKIHHRRWSTFESKPCAWPSYAEIWPPLL